MDKRVKNKSGKKSYSKPQITQVKLAVTQATLGTCYTISPTISNSSFCQTTVSCPLGA